MAEFHAAQRTAPRITIADVARHAGVSTATVSRVLNNPDVVAPDTVTAVMSAITELNYVPHGAASQLAGRRPKTLGLVFPNISDQFLMMTLEGISAEAKKQGYELLVYSAIRPLDAEMFYLPIGEHNVDGIILFTGSLTAAETARLHHRGLPLVLLHQSAPAGLAVPCVTFTNKAGARAMTEHLIQGGYRRIAFLMGPDGNEDSYWREQGYREALADHDIPFRPELVGRGDFWDAVAETAVYEWLDRGVEMDAIFAGDDISARGAIYALLQRGKRVPEDVAVVGFDDVYFAKYLVPSLTTIHAPIQEAGQLAVTQIMRQLNGEPIDLLTLLPTELVIRDSCGCQH